MSALGTAPAQLAAEIAAARAVHGMVEAATGRCPDSSRILRRFEMLAAQGRAGLICFLTAGDPDAETSLALLRGLPAAGADLIELGIPFTDPMADGPAIQASSLRALRAGATLRKTLAQVRAFRAGNAETPVILMGYFNPIYSYGVPALLRDAREAGVDGLIVVDLPPEEDEELCNPALNAGVNFIRLATPTTDDARLPHVMHNATGFVYYVAIAGITGTRSAELADVIRAVERLKGHTELPIAVGFGIKSPEQAAAIAKVADAAVVGSALVNCLAENLDEHGRAKPGLVDSVLDLVSRLSDGVRRSRR